MTSTRVPARADEPGPAADPDISTPMPSCIPRSYVVARRERLRRIGGRRGAGLARLLRGAPPVSRCRLVMELLQIGLVGRGPIRRKTVPCRRFVDVWCRPILARSASPPRPAARARPRSSRRSKPRRARRVQAFARRARAVVNRSARTASAASPATAASTARSGSPSPSSRAWIAASPQPLLRERSGPRLRAAGRRRRTRPSARRASALARHRRATPAPCEALSEPPL